MVEEPTKTLKVRVHGALAFFRGASCSIKTRDPVQTEPNNLSRHNASDSQCNEQK
jgi:hypothetical protein